MTALSPVRRLLASRWPQLITVSVLLGGYLLAIATGLLGSPVGSRNFGIVAVWIGWWTVLILLAVPLFGRAWCSVCPIPAPGDWLQRGGVLRPTDHGVGLGRRWPARLRNMWPQNLAFAGLAVSSTVVLTQPRVTALVLLALLLVAVGLALVYERRTFCRYLCPVGGFVGLYSQLAPVELRVRDKTVCASHSPKTCYVGCAAGAGCPWLVYPGALTRNTYCGLCLECLRTCPYDNVAVNIRPFGTDLDNPRGRGLDEAFKALIMLGSAVAYTAVLLGPWGPLKSAAYAVATPAWLLYAAAFLFFLFVAVPGSYGLAVMISRRWGTSPARPRTLFVRFSAALIPLGLAAWIAFTLGFALANISYLWPALSDPLGRGWDLFGTANASWRPLLGTVTPALQTVTLAGGSWWASATAVRIARAEPAARPARLATPIIGYMVALAVGLLILLAG